uniref:Uncharacterized protein n=1 Tax=Saccoglossus kowalevskii TaxID=10224 RepID=A0ABM0MTJ8_SACKO|nr:PREDICTED: putative protein TPRXL-like [Saccoglossus kowalevskii]
MYSSYNSRISNYITPPSTGYHTRCHHGSHHGNRSADTARYRSTGLDYNGYRSTRSPTTSWNRSPSSYDSFSYSSGRSSLTSPSYTPSYSSRTHAEYSPKYSTPSRSRSSSSCTDAEIPTTPFSPISTSTRFSSFAQRPPSPRVSTPKTLNFSRDDLDISPLSPTITKHDDESNSPDGSNSTEKQFEKPDRSKWSEFLEPNDDNTGVVKHVAEGGRWVGE